MTAGRGRDTKAALGPACRAFLRSLAAHVDQALSSDVASQPCGHVAGCQGCARLLGSAIAQVRLLRSRPRVPSALQSRAAYEGVLARAIEDLEATELGRMLAQAAPLAPAADVAWPVPCESDSELARTLAGSQGQVRRQVVPGWVWLRVKDQIRAEAVRRTTARTRRGRLLRSFAVAGALLLAALIVLPFARPDRTPVGSGGSEPMIVMERMQRAPAIDYLPAAVLRHGVDK